MEEMTIAEQIHRNMSLGQSVGSFDRKGFDPDVIWAAREVNSHHRNHEQLTWFKVRQRRYMDSCTRAERAAIRNKRNEALRRYRNDA